MLLFQAQNNIRCLGGLEKLESLVSLHLRDNQIDNLDGLSSNMTCLQYLNVRYTDIAQINLFYKIIYNGGVELSLLKHYVSLYLSVL